MCGIVAPGMTLKFTGCIDSPDCKLRAPDSNNALPCAKGVLCKMWKAQIFIQPLAAGDTFLCTPYN